ncbi:MAG: hypothetical protein KBD64_07950 [Gammaproteobacteria bacterium]|nr:hypothetical protein [Gammaproteobacteria bacterium]
MNQSSAISNILIKAQSLRGYTLGELTDYLNINNNYNKIFNNKIINNKLVNKKGLTGQIVEYLLGATAQSKPMPDFPELGLEVKTLPIDLSGRPLETTYICTVPLVSSETSSEFQCSVLYQKTQHILWVPIIISEKNKNFFNQRTIGNAFLWQPNATQISLIQQDWTELTEMIITGQIEKITSHYGKVLQIRPKAANSRVITQGLNLEGATIATLPRGFYLRTSFTSEIYLNSNSGTDILP